LLKQNIETSGGDSTPSEVKSFNRLIIEVGAIKNEKNLQATRNGLFETILINGGIFLLYYIKGDVAFVGEDFIVIDNHDIGYKINTSDVSISDIKGHEWEKITIYTMMIHREDDMSIYGFSTQEELKMFQMLITVSGVGARLALGILSSIPYNELVGMIIVEDIGGLVKAQGVGKKTAQRMVLELKDKIDKHLSFIQPVFNQQSNTKNDMQEAVNALMALGYAKSEAEKAVAAVEDEGLNIEGIIKKSLRFLSR